MNVINLEFVGGGAEFIIKLLEKLKTSSSKENIIISPFSIQACLALVFAGANDDTAKEITAAMKYVSDCPAQYVLKKYSDLVKITNKIYVQEGKSIRDDYAALIYKEYHAEAESINFENGVEAANTINKWMENYSSAKIKNILATDALDASTRLVLLNALLFKGKWLEKFDNTKTHVGDFRVGDDETVAVKYMNKSGRFAYAYFNELNCSALEMPYKDCDLSMFVLLPEDTMGWSNLIAKLKDVNLLDLASLLQMCDVVVKFPKFKVNYQMELKKVLQEMGIAKAFSDEADLSNMFDTDEAISVSQVYHKAWIEVNEDGAEASAVTVPKMRVVCHRLPIEFTADHPFLYWIGNKKTVLFAGVFVNPP